MFIHVLSAYQMGEKTSWSDVFFFFFSQPRSVLIFHCFSSLSGLVVSTVQTSADTISVEKPSDSGFAKPTIT